MVEALRDGEAPAVVRQQRETLARLVAEGATPDAVARVLDLTETRVLVLAKRYGFEFPEPEDTAAPGVGEVVPDMLVALRALAQRADAVARGSIAAVSPEQAADWSAELWSLLVPLVGLRTEVDRRARKR
jgi:hypothetical protein